MRKVFTQDRSRFAALAAAPLKRGYSRDFKMIDGISVDPELAEEAYLERIAEIWLESVGQMAGEEDSPCCGVEGHATK